MTKQAQRNPQWLEGRAAADTGATEYYNPYDPETDYWKAATDAATYAATRDATYAATDAATRAATRAATYDATRDATYAAQFACGFGHGRQVLAIRALLNGESAQ